jgi:hypothetical protein
MLITATGDIKAAPELFSIDSLNTSSTLNTRIELFSATAKSRIGTVAKPVEKVSVKTTYLKKERKKITKQNVIFSNQITNKTKTILFFEQHQPNKNNQNKKKRNFNQNNETKNNPFQSRSVDFTSNNNGGYSGTTGTSLTMSLIILNLVRRGSRIESPRSVSKPFKKRNKLNKNKHFNLCCSNANQTLSSLNILSSLYSLSQSSSNFFLLFFFSMTSHLAAHAVYERGRSSVCHSHNRMISQIRPNALQHHGAIDSNHIRTVHLKQTKNKSEL